MTLPTGKSYKWYVGQVSRLIDDPTVRAQWRSDHTEETDLQVLVDDAAAIGITITIE